MRTLFMLHALVLFAAFLTVAVAVYAIACVPTQQPNLLGIRGLKRVRALESNVQFAGIEPALRWFGMQLRRVLGGGTLASIDRRLMLAGDFWGLLAEEFVALCVLSAGTVFLLSGVYATVADQPLDYRAAAMVAIAALLPYSRLAAAQESRQKRVSLGLPPVIDLLVLCLSAGLDLPGALRQVVSKSSNPTDPLIEELGFVLEELQVGKTRKAALLQFAERVPIEPVREFVGAIVQAEEHGNPLARVLQIHAEVSRQRRTVRAEEAASRAGVKMTFPLVLVFGAVLILIAGPMFLSMQKAF